VQLLLGIKKDLAPWTDDTDEAGWLPDRANTAHSYHMGIIDILQVRDSVVFPLCVSARGLFSTMCTCSAAYRSIVFWLNCCILPRYQKWNWQKRAERFIKAVRGKDIDGLSATDPTHYRTRFVTAMGGHFAKEELCDESPTKSMARMSRATSNRAGQFGGGGGDGGSAPAPPPPPGSAPPPPPPPMLGLEPEPEREPGVSSPQEPSYEPISRMTS
jgi:hypothetical protein